MIELLCESPAKIFGMWPRKGTISPGSDADIVIFDPAREVTISHRDLTTNCDYSPFEGTQVTGWAQTTLVRGATIVRDGKFVGKVGHGQFIKRVPTGNAA
jgi:dihydropyrimidinase